MTDHLTLLLVGLIIILVWVAAIVVLAITFEFLVGLLEQFP